MGTQNGRIVDRTLRDDIAEHAMNDRAFSLTVRRNVAESQSTQAPSFVSSMFKFYGTEQNKRRLELMIQAMSTQMLGWEVNGFEPEELTQTRAWLRSKANSIEGGTSEVQLNIIAKPVLGLPD